MIVVCGQSGVGKTTLARTLNSAIVLDLDKGCAIEGHPIDVIRPRTWAEVVTLPVSCGPIPRPAGSALLSGVLRRGCRNVWRQCRNWQRYDTLVDSITVAGRLCFSGAYSNLRRVLSGQESWTHAQLTECMDVR